MLMDITMCLIIIALIIIVVKLYRQAEKLPCPKCKQVAEITSKGDEFVTEHYCSNCYYKYD